MAGGTGVADYRAGWFDTWAGRVLEGLGAPKTPANIKSLHAWSQAEGADTQYNPLDTTLPEPGATNFNPIGVKNYRSLDQGVQATVETLESAHGSRYSGIITDLQQGQGIHSRQALRQMSVWGTSPSLYSKIDGGTYNPGTTDTGKPIQHGTSFVDEVGNVLDYLNPAHGITDFLANGGFKNPLDVFNTLAKPLFWLIAPNNITRVVLFILGVIFILLGFFFLAKDMTG